MANLAKTYHEQLQNKGLEQDEEKRELALDTALDAIETTLSDQDHDSLATLLSEDITEKALKSLPNGKAAGIDGLPTELWKSLHQDYQDTMQSDKPHANIVEILTIVYNNIETRGIDPRSTFTLGWMCPLYKKNERSNIANYRPITLLNTDYKIFTTALTLKLAKVAPSIIHADQAGFMTGRSIFDQVKLADLMTHYADTTEDCCGAIVALDQEKAYDKISHTYLWAVMEKFNVPQHFIQTVCSLYENAKTLVIINGESSETFRVTRGVRQGDPLSCLLFNIAIEPLACMIRKSDLKGFAVPGAPERILIKLFADDTTVYLSKADSFERLQGILSAWCTASGAKFNVNKTEIIPIGTADYRDWVYSTRQLNNGHKPIDADIHILQDGESARILGGWIGNHSDGQAPWVTVIEKVERNLTRWGRSHPTLDGRKLIIQMIVGGMTQYLTKIQGMPKDIENRLIQIIRRFIWNSESTPTVSLETLMSPKSSGGKDLLDLKARNEAIALTDLASYLKLGCPDRPTWAFVADEMIKRNAPSGQRTSRNAKATLQPIIQNWKPVLNSSWTTLPPTIVRMLKVGQEHNVSFEALMLEPDLRKQLPIWHHIGAHPKMTYNINTHESKCLHDNHLVVTVGDMERIAQRNPAHHKKRRNGTSKKRKPCTCNDCKEDRDKGCKNPHACLRKAHLILKHILPKWHPHTPMNNDNLELNEDEREQNEDARENNTRIRFNPSITINGPLSNGIRVFTDPSARMNQQPWRQHTHPEQNEPITVHTDGSCLHSGQQNATAGSGIWYGPDDPRNTALRVPNDLPQTNQTAELLAVWHAVKEAPLMSPLHIKSDSRYVIDGLTRNLESWEQRGLIRVANKQLFQATAGLLRRRGNVTTFQWIKGHQGVRGNEEADKLAKEGAGKPECIRTDIKIPPRFHLTGAQLCESSQATLTQGIKEKRKTQYRRQTAVNLEKTRWAIHDYLNGGLPTDEKIWKSLENKDIPKTLRVFLWRLMHNAYKIGEYWNNIPGYEDRGRCPFCDEEESMEHILIECQAPEREYIWSLAKELWERKGLPWPELRIGSVLGSGHANFTHPNGKPRPGANRLYRILMTESAHLIWVLRCERRIKHADMPNANISEIEAHNKWVHKINTRLTLDKITSDKMKFKKLATNPDTALQTWSGVLDDEQNLPENWLRRSGVLVGIRARRAPGRNR